MRTAKFLTAMAAVLLTGACSSGGTSVSSATTFPPITPSTSVPPQRTTPTTAPATTMVCHGAPAAAPGLAWLPADLPLPPGAYSAFDYSTDAAHHRALINVPAPQASSVNFITGMWGQRGWQLKAAPLPNDPQRYGYSRPKSPASGVVSVAVLGCDPSWSQISLSLTVH